MKLRRRLTRYAAGALHAARVGLLHRPGLRAALRCVCAFGAGFVLALAPLLHRPLPLAVALPAALGFNAAGICAYLGAAAGYALAWGFGASLEFLAGGFLILAACCLFGDLRPGDRSWFAPLCAAALYLLPALACLLGGRTEAFDAVFLAAKLLLLAAATAAFTAALGEKRQSRGALALALLAGCGGVTLPGALPLGAVLAAGAAFLAVPAPGYLLCAAACGLTVDLTSPQSLSLCALLSFAALVCHGAELSSRPLRAGLYLTALAAGVIFTGAQAAELLVCGLLGTLAALAVPRRALLLFQTQAPAGQEPDGLQMDKLDEVLGDLTRTLDRSDAFDTGPQPAAVFDRAAGQVCKHCENYALCWREKAEQTVRTLSRCAQTILRQGQIRPDDLSAEFLARCGRQEDFLAAVNGAIEERRCRLQYQARLRESRRVLADQYRFLARAVRAMAAPKPAAPARFAPELAIDGRGVQAGGVSGDHGCSFSAGAWYYVLLCDGMGTGPDARQESRAAARLLQNLIESGFDPADALQMLNGVYILRQDGCFATADLVQLSLVTGEGYLYKWGAPRSYLICEEEVEKIGTASPPPGLGVGESHQAECVKLSLQEGQTLVLVSDGVCAGEAERYLRQYRSQPARELAAGLLRCGEGKPEDDQTACALRLRPLSARKKHSTGRRKILSKPYI